MHTKILSFSEKYNKLQVEKLISDYKFMSDDQYLIENGLSYSSDVNQKLIKMIKKYPLDYKFLAVFGIISGILGIVSILLLIKYLAEHLV